jgi:hypothetical protein
MKVLNSLIKKEYFVGCRWLMPIILVTQEAEIRRIKTSKSSQANSSRDPISKKQNKTGLEEWLKW